MKRVLCLVSSLLLTLFFVGCHTVTPPASDTTPTDPDGTTVTPPKTLCLAYNREDTLDPFSASTQLNLCLSSLLYEPLLRPGADFAPVLVLAQSAEQTDSTHITVTLRKGAAFSDGSAVTADDVIFSFNKAKASANCKVALANVQAASAKRGVITFTLSSADPNGSYNLYFPIIKRSTDTSAAATAAVGSGPYVFNADGQKLTANAKNAVGAAAQNKEIQLLSLMDNDAVLQNLEKGSIHYMFNDLGDGDIPRTSAKDTAVDLPQLVYLGVNSSRAALAAPAVRQALSAAIDRTALAASSYAGRALPATTPFHPKWRPAVGLSAFSAGSEAGKVNALLQAAQTVPTTTGATGATGATGVTTPTTVATTAATTAATHAGETAATTSVKDTPLTLLYAGGNRCREALVKALVQQLHQAGFQVTARPTGFDDYKAQLSAGNYDLYIGEIRLTPSMNLFVFLRAGGAAAFGVNTAGEAAQTYAAYRAGEKTAAEFVEAFSRDMPYIPLCYRQGMAAGHAALTYITPSAYSVYDGITH